MQGGAANPARGAWKPRDARAGQYFLGRVAVTHVQGLPKGGSALCSRHVHTSVVCRLNISQSFRARTQQANCLRPQRESSVKTLTTMVEAAVAKKMLVEAVIEAVVRMVQSPPHADHARDGQEHWVAPWVVVSGKRSTTNSSFLGSFICCSLRTVLRTKIYFSAKAEPCCPPFTPRRSNSQLSSGVPGYRSR